MYLALMPILKTLISGRGSLFAISKPLIPLWPHFIFVGIYFMVGSPAGYLWSLAVEGHFYLLLPATIALLAASRRLHWIMGSGGSLFALGLVLRCWAVSHGAEDSSVYFHSQFRIDSLFLGVMLRYWDMYRCPWKLSSTAGLGMIAAGIGSWCLAFGFNFGLKWNLSFGLSIRTIGAALILYGTWLNRAMISAAGKRRLGLPLRIIGRIGLGSYGIYVWHVTAMRIAAESLQPEIARVFGVSGFGWFIETVVYATVAIIMGMLMTWLIELPALRLRERLLPAWGQIAHGDKEADPKTSSHDDAQPSKKPSGTLLSSAECRPE